MWILCTPQLTSRCTVAEMLPALTVPKSLLPSLSRMFNCVVQSPSAVCLCTGGDPEMIPRVTRTFVVVVFY